MSREKTKELKRLAAFWWQKSPDVLTYKTELMQTISNSTIAKEKYEKPYHKVF
jgi:hypothetical protein